MNPPRTLRLGALLAAAFAVTTAYAGVSSVQSSSYRPLPEVGFRPVGVPADVAVPTAGIPAPTPALVAGRLHAPLVAARTGASAGATLEVDGPAAGLPEPGVRFVPLGGSVPTGAGTTVGGGGSALIAPMPSSRFDALRPIPGASSPQPWNGWNAGSVSWYGPGFYGHRTACGYALTFGLVGVAHRSLPCGTLVTFRYAGRIVVAPVVDRGPYVRGRAWDLTAGLAIALGHLFTGPIEWRIRY